MNNKYKLLVFDWDGTLIDSIEQIVVSLQHASKNICAENISEQAARSVIGLGLTEAIETLHPEIEQTLIEKVATAYKQHYLHENPIQPKLFDGVTDMLDELTDNNFKLAIATGKSRAGLDRSLQEHKLEHYFVTTRCAGEFRSKPHPEMLVGIVNDLNIASKQTLMIGDSEHDLMMANNAQIDGVAVTDDSQQAKTLMQHQPLICLDKITDLSLFLSHNNKTL
jgi:phosphoglycolate phosphatase